MIHVLLDSEGAMGFCAALSETLMLNLTIWWEKCFILDVKLITYELAVHTAPAYLCLRC